jgi:hypothetical protein
VYSAKQDKVRATEYYQKALSIRPGLQSAKDGLRKVSARN